MMNTSWAISQDVSTVSDRTIVVLIARIGHEAIKHLQLVRDRVHQLLVFSVSCIIGVQGTCLLKSLACFLDLTKCHLRLEKTLVNARERWVDANTSLTVFYSPTVLLECDKDGRSIRVDLFCGLHIEGLRVELDCALVVLSFKGFVSLGFQGFSLSVACSFNHYLLKFV